MTAESRNHLLDLAGDLEALLAGQVEPEAVRRRWAGPQVSEFMVWIEHFLSDADIRAKDREYRQMQESEMRKLIQCLRTGRLEEARRITFLRPTDARQ